MAFKQIILPNGDTQFIDAAKVVAVTQQTNRPATGTPTTICNIFLVDTSEDSRFVVPGTAVDTMRKLGLTFTTTP